MYGRGGILLFSLTVWVGSWGGDEGHTQEHTHTGTYTQMLHLPFSDPPLRKCPKNRPKMDEDFLALFGLFFVTFKMIEKMGGCRGPASSQTLGLWQEF